MKFKKMLITLSVPSTLLISSALTISCGEEKDSSIERKSILSASVVKAKLATTTSEASALALLSEGQMLGRSYKISSSAKIMNNKIIFKAKDEFGMEFDFEFEKNQIFPEFKDNKVPETPSKEQEKPKVEESKEIKEAKEYAKNLFINYKDRFSVVSWEEMSNEDGSLKQEDFVVVNGKTGYKPIANDRYSFSNMKWVNKSPSDFEKKANKRFITFDLKNEVTGVMVKAKSEFKGKSGDYLFDGGFREASEQETKQVQEEFISKLQVTESGKQVLSKLKVGDVIWYDAKDDKIFDKPRYINNNKSEGYTKDADKIEVLTLNSDNKNYEPRTVEWRNKKESELRFVVTKVEDKKVTFTFKVAQNIFMDKNANNKFITKPLTLELSF